MANKYSDMRVSYNWFHCDRFYAGSQGRNDISPELYQILQTDSYWFCETEVTNTVNRLKKTEQNKTSDAVLLRF